MVRRDSSSRRPRCVWTREWSPTQKRQGYLDEGGYWRRLVGWGKGGVECEVGMG